jgi:hypothetical protein
MAGDVDPHLVERIRLVLEKLSMLDPIVASRDAGIYLSNWIKDADRAARYNIDPSNCGFGSRPEFVHHRLVEASRKLTWVDPSKVSAEENQGLREEARQLLIEVLSVLSGEQQPPFERNPALP